MHKEDLLQFDAAMVIAGADGTGETHNWPSLKSRA
jgi:hypothetical protein